MLWSSLSQLAGQPAAVRLTPPVSNLNPLLKWAPVTQSPYSAASLSWPHASSRPLSMCASLTLLWEILDSLGDTHMPWKPEVLAQAHLPRNLLRTLPMNHGWLLYILNMWLSAFSKGAAVSPGYALRNNKPPCSRIPQISLALPTLCLLPQNLIVGWEKLFFIVILKG